VGPSLKNGPTLLRDRTIEKEFEAFFISLLERVDGPERVVVPRLRLGPVGEDEHFWILNAWKFKGARLLYPRAPDAGD
jgi:hypothetical protein